MSTIVERRKKQIASIAVGIKNDSDTIAALEAEIEQLTALIAEKKGYVEGLKENTKHDEAEKAILEGIIATLQNADKRGINLEVCLVEKEDKKKANETNEENDNSSLKSEALSVTSNEAKPSSSIRRKKSSPSFSEMAAKAVDIPEPVSNPKKTVVFNCKKDSNKKDSKKDVNNTNTQFNYDLCMFCRYAATHGYEKGPVHEQHMCPCYGGWYIDTRNDGECPDCNYHGDDIFRDKYGSCSCVKEPKTVRIPKPLKTLLPGQYPCKFCYGVVGVDHVSGKCPEFSLSVNGEAY